VSRKDVLTPQTKAFFQRLETLAPKTARRVTGDSSGQSHEEVVEVKIRYKPVTWGFCLDEVIFSKWFIQFLRQQMMPWDSVVTAQSTYLPDARNLVHRDFLKTENEYLVMLDSDVIPPPDFLSRLLAHKLPMVGGWYRKKGVPYPPVVYDNEQPPNEKGIIVYKVREVPGTGLEKVSAAGAGCWLMSREVAMAIGEHPFDMIHGGEDLELCRKVHAAGFDTWVDWSCACAHTGVAIV